MRRSIIERELRAVGSMEREQLTDAAAGSNAARAKLGTGQPGAASRAP